MFTDKGPAVVPQPARRFAQVAGVQQELVRGFVDQIFALQHHACGTEEQAGHKQRVVPQMTGVRLLFHHMLEAALFGFWQGA